MNDRVLSYLIVAVCVAALITLIVSVGKLLLLLLLLP
jgi:hypothetical protein